MEAPRPRAAVIAELWVQAGIAAPALVNRSGLPLARTVKCLLDPLVLQPRVHRELGKALLTSADAELAAGLLRVARPQIENTGRWYELLRAERDRQQIIEGNAQELYFPRAFELAVTVGTPGADAAERCAEMLAEVHGQTQPGLEELLAQLADRGLQDRIAADWADCWGQAEHIEDLAAIAERVLAALDDDSDALAELIGSDLGSRIGLSLQDQSGLVGRLLAAAGLANDKLRLSEADPLAPPGFLGAGAGILDRTLEQRVRSALRRHREDGMSITAGEIIADEADRAAAGFGLAGGDTQALFLAGVVLAAGLEPLAETAEPGRPALFVRLQARLRKEAYVMHLRRELAGGRAIHPDQRPVVDALRQFWRPWLGRLWVRLHGRDVTQTSVEYDAVELLTGITRSVLLDHRQQIRGSLEKVAA